MDSEGTADGADLLRETEGFSVEVLGIAPHKQVADDQDGHAEKAVLVNEVREHVLWRPYSGSDPQDVVSPLDE